MTNYISSTNIQENLSLENLKGEIWKDVPDFPNYKVSSLGRVKSFKRGEKILKQIKNSEGYYKITLQGIQSKKTKATHQIVASAFLNHNIDGNIKVIDHIDSNKSNNRLSNLRIVTHRVNISKERNPKSGFTGVVFDKKRKLWVSSITNKGKKYNFECPILTSCYVRMNVYQETVK